MTVDDFEIITENGKHLGEEGDFNKEQFHGMSTAASVQAFPVEAAALLTLEKTRTSPVMLI